MRRDRRADLAVLAPVAPLAVLAAVVDAAQARAAARGRRDGPARGADAAHEALAGVHREDALLEHGRRGRGVAVVELDERQERALHQAVDGVRGRDDEPRRGAHHAHDVGREVELGDLGA